MYIHKKILLIVLSIVTGIMIFNLLADRSSGSKIKSVKRVDAIKENHSVICPYCRKKMQIQDFAETTVPNMTQCPQCQKQVHKPLLIGQVALRNR